MGGFGAGIFSSLRSLRPPWLRSLRHSGPSAVPAMPEADKPQGHNTPLRESPASLPEWLQPILDKS